MDWARESICRGEDIPELSEAYQHLDKAVLERREQFNRLFAKVAGGLDLRRVRIRWAS